MDTIGWRSGRVPGDVGLRFGRTGNGPNPIVALHGITAQHRAFNAFARHLRHPDGIAALDLRGRGDSAKPGEGGYGLEAHARDVARLLDHLDVQRGVICGHSMGAFVALKTAMLFPERVAALILLDGGWPRPEEPPDEEATRELEEGLNRAFARLEMTFESEEAYLEFWFPGQGLTFEVLPPDLANYYRYDLEKVDGGFRPKASLTAAHEDSASASSESPTLQVLGNVACPVMLARAAEGFFPGSSPLISDETRDAMAGVLDLRADLRLEGATHYTMLLLDEHARRVAGAADEFLRGLG